MDPEEFAAAVQIVWGGVPEAAVGLGMSERNVRAFSSGEKGIHQGLADDVMHAVRYGVHHAPAPRTPAMAVIRRAVERGPLG